MPRLVHCLVLPFVASIASLASAQSAGNFAIDEFRPAMDARGYLTVNGSEVLDDKQLSFGLGSLEWGRHLLQVQNGSSVDNAVTATLVAALGLNVGGIPFEVGASLPLSIMSGNLGPGMGQLDEQGTGDLGLHLKAQLAHAGPFGLAAIASVYLPTASEAFLGDGGVTPQVIGVADAVFGRFRFAINGGVRLRQTSSVAGPMVAGMIMSSTELPVGAAAAWALAPQKLELIGEVFGAVPLGEHRGYQALEALGGVKLYLAKNSYMSLGAGRGLATEQAGNPDFRAVIGIVFEPKPAAVTHRHVVDDDEVAVAPPTPPTADRDGGTIADRDDKCPDEERDTLGECMPRETVKVVGSQIVTLESIEFEFDKAILRTSAYPILDGVAKALRDNPDITLVEVQGHTDEQGDDAYNLDLSKRRAAAVVTYLTSHAIDAARLTSQGYGETRPLDLHHTQEAYTKNRRVEFHIIHQSTMD